MRYAYYDCRRSVTTSTGTGDLTLTAGTGPFTEIDEADFGTDTFTYRIAGTTQWEVGRGHLDTGNVLVRDHVLDSSSATIGPTGQINFTAGEKEVICTFTSETADGLSEINSFGVPTPGRAGTATTTDATPTAASPELAAATVGQSYVAEITVIAQTAAFKTKSWTITFMGVYDGVDLTMFGKVVTDIAESESLTWDVDASIVSNAPVVTVTGAAATTIDWYVYGSVKALVPAA